MQRVSIDCGLENSSYDILIGYKILSSVPSDLIKVVHATRFCIVTDENVNKLYGAPLRDAFQALNITPLIKVIPPGEHSKTREMKAEIEDWMLANLCGRDSCIIALGGGVIGDLAGFVAATFMRGIPFVQVPTSLLACVDSSVGGKTAVDSPAGKNLIGAFHQPRRVYIDLALLSTLPRREFVNGLAEVIKIAAILSVDLFSLLEEHCDKILEANVLLDQLCQGNAPETPSVTESCRLLMDIVCAAVRLKAGVVSADEREGGYRAVLNFGHSIGHAIEAIMTPLLLHGECVAIGMVKEAAVARSAGVLSSPSFGRLVRCLRMFGLPTRMPSARSCPPLDVIRWMAVDKKNADGKKMLVMLAELGRVQSSPSFTSPVADIAILRSICSAVTVSLKEQPRAADFSPRSNFDDPACPPLLLRVPGSKSISNRALLMAVLGTGVCRIRGLLHSDDTQVMMRALQRLGGKFEWEEEGAVLVVHGTAGRLACLPDLTELYLSNAGTAARFITSASTLPLSGTRLIITGDSRMKERPIGPLVEALRAHGCEIDYLGSSGCLPLAVRGTGLCSGLMRLEAKLSSQYVSSVLISAPYAIPTLTDAESFLDLVLNEENPTSLPYIRMTLSLMRQFGMPALELASNHFRIPTGRGGYINPPELVIEADASSATYPLALAAVMGTGQHSCNCGVTILGVGNKSLQGDANFSDLLQKMGCVVKQTATDTHLSHPNAFSRLQAPAGEIHMGEMTDSFMTLAALAVVAQGTTRIVGIANQRVKETNRIAAMITELGRLGVIARELPDGLEIEGVEDLRSLQPAFIECYNDHRIAMAFAVLSAATPRGLITILDKECTEKTYPEFWDDIQNGLGLNVNPVPQITGAELVDSSAASITIPGEDSAKLPEKRPAIPCFDCNSSWSASRIILIGMRAAGKSSLGAFAGSELSCSVTDIDALLLQRLCYQSQETTDSADGGMEMTLSSFVMREGWAAFRATEAALIAEVLKKPPPPALSQNAVAVGDFSGCELIVCGGGVVESPETVKMLQDLRMNPDSRSAVIHVHSDFKDVARRLGQLETSGVTPVKEVVSGSHRPKCELLASYGEPLAAVWARRKPLYRSAASHEFFILEGDDDWQKINRDFCRLIRFLASPRMPATLEPFTSSTDFVNERRGWHPGCGSFFACLTFPEITTSDVRAFLRRPETRRCVPPLGAGDNVRSNSTLLTCSSMSTIEQQIVDRADGQISDWILYGCDAVELRADLLRDWTEDFVHAQIAALRRDIPCEMPIIFTVRSQRQGGCFPDGEEEAALSLLRVGRAAGVEVLDVEISNWSSNFCDTILRERRAERLIASLHIVPPFSSPSSSSSTPQQFLLEGKQSPVLPALPQLPSCPAEYEALFDICASWNSAPSAVAPLPWDVIKVVIAATSEVEATEISLAGRRWAMRRWLQLQSTSIDLPCLPVPIVIAVATTARGALSRILNSAWTPVTHPCSVSAAAPGQLTLAAIVDARAAIGRSLAAGARADAVAMIDSSSLNVARLPRFGLGLDSSPRSFFLFGSPITASPSPDMHNAGFALAGLGNYYHYEIFECGSDAESLSRVRALMLRPNFGGASVTVPLKEAILPLLDSLSPAAEAIGAVNTVLVEYDAAGKRILVGDNTDWIGIYFPILN